MILKKISNNSEIKPLSVTVTMISYNDEKIIEDCFKSIKRQKYAGKVSILIVDGGSSDKTIKIAKKYGAQIILKPEYRDKPYKRGDIAMNSVKTDIALFFSADNRFQEVDCLKKMMVPFVDKEICAVETFKYGYRKKDSLLTKYFALIGGTDPIAIALGKADRAPYDAYKWHSYGKVVENSKYFKVSFDNEINKIPTLGANGFAVRRNLIKKYPLKDSLHIEMCVNLISAGYNKFAFVKNAHIVHDIQISIFEFLRRKLQWKKMYSDINNIKRIYLVYNHKKDKIKLILIVISAVTFIVPVIKSIRGYFRKQEVAWFLHPIIYAIFVISYGLSCIRFGNSTKK